MRDVGSHRAEKGRKAGCSMRRGALEGLESNHCRGGCRPVADRNHRGSCLRCRGCSLLSTTKLLVVSQKRQREGRLMCLRGNMRSVIGSAEVFEAIRIILCV
jgi:hypothetical protein